MLQRNLFIFISLTLILIIPNNIYGQIDSSYIMPFDQDFSAKTYIVNKYFAFDKQNEKDKSQEYSFKTNSPISVGVGVSWKSFSFSFSHGFDFMRDKNKGKTKSLEFQHHGYGRKLTYDLILQHHKGFYNEKKNKANNSYTLYPDITINMYGGSLQYVFNNKRFSYKAAFNQNERQIKSTGSLIAGATLYYSKISTDSTHLFDRMSNVHENLQIGLSIGYVYTWVIDKKWYLTGSFTIGGSIGNNYPSRFFKKKMDFLPILDARFAMGYNANKWSLGASANFNKIFLFHNKYEDLGMINATFRLTYTYRFNWGNKFVNSTLESLNKAKQKLGI